jgi:hypothetical protein
MTPGWTGDVDETDDPNDSTDNGFAATLQSHVDDGVAEQIGEAEFFGKIDDVDDVALLEQARNQLDGEKQNIVQNRLEELGWSPDDGSDESGSNGGWGGQPVDEVESPDDEDSGSDGAEPEIESLDEMEAEDEALGGETDESEAESLSEPAESPPTPSGSVSVEQAADRERRWKVMVWGPPGLFKSHFAYTAPEPVAFIDTERKAHDIAHKFADREIQIWQPEDFHEAQDALKEAIEWLDWWRENEDELGTIVIDSMSLMWEWAKTAYKTEAYPMTDNEEVTLSSNMGSSQESDWQHIKGMHNSEFRQWMTDSPYHFVWTAGETEDYAAVMDDDENTGSSTPMKAEGEKNNVHKADSIIRARKDEDGVKVGDLTKSNFTDHLFLGLERPTFPRLAETIETIEGAETSDETIDREELEAELGVDIIRGDPSQYD